MKYRKCFRAAAWMLGGLVLSLGGLGAWGWSQLRGSLPQLAGEARVAGLSRRVEVARDAMGVPTLRGESRLDVARALGYLHAQERFFQMDLTRRRAAGELAALLGKAALRLDREARRHDFRLLAEARYRKLPADQQLMISAYTEGVNAGLQALGKKPFEYIVLRTEPVPWKNEDVLLAIYAMALDLQEDTASYEFALGAIRTKLGEAALNFLAPNGSVWDAPLEGSAFPTLKLPAKEEFQIPRKIVAKGPSVGQQMDETRWDDFATATGSNSVALSGAHTESGIPLIAGDMHLGLHVPNTWYRARMIWPAELGTGIGAHDLIGLTLPGAPLLIAGSNRQIAWQFTNARADAMDLVLVEVAEKDPQQYRVSAGSFEAFTRRVQSIAIKGQKPVEQETLWTRWGPIIGRYDDRHWLALRWTMHDADAVDLNLQALETTAMADQALALAKTCGVPTLNIMVVDHAGHIGWTVAGRLPWRTKHNGRWPVSWADGEGGWTGYLPVDEYPALFDPKGGRLWAGNNRMLGGEALKKMGDGRYDLGARAKQLRDDIAGLEKTKPSDLLAVQIDDRALFLERWQKLFLQVLTPEAVAADPRRAELRRLVENWNGRASTDAVGYNLVRAWRARMLQQWSNLVLQPCREAYADFKVGQLELEDALWLVLHEKPAHLLDPKMQSWEGFMLYAADYVVIDGKKRGGLAEWSWGKVNTARIPHALSAGLPTFVARWLDMPAQPLPGDNHMPRVQAPSFGASDRMVLSPSREEEGLFAMPGGQSGHPLSAHYRAGHADWAEGRATTLNPGVTVTTLTLDPAPAGAASP